MYGHWSMGVFGQSNVQYPSNTTMPRNGHQRDDDVFIVSKVPRYSPKVVRSGILVSCTPRSLVSVQWYTRAESLNRVPLTSAISTSNAW